MALARGAVAVRFEGGIETKRDYKSVPSTKLLALENGVFTKAISIVKRWGYEALSRAIEASTSLLTGAKRLAVRESELVAFTQTTCYSRQTENWTEAGACISAIGSDRPAVRTGTMQTSPDHASNGGVTVYAWEDSRGGVWWSAVDGGSGRISRAPEQLDGNGSRPRCLPVGELLHIYWANTNDKRIYVVVINPSLPSAAVTPAILADDLSEDNPAYDACVTQRTGAPALIAWAEQGTTNVRFGYVDVSGQLGSPASGHPSVFRDTFVLKVGSPIACAYFYSDGATNDDIAIARVLDNDELHVTRYYGGDGSTAFTLQTDDVAFTTTAINRLAMTYDSARLIWVVAEEDAAESSQRYSQIASTTAFGSPTTLRSVGLATRAFAVGDDTYAVFVHDTTYFNTYVALRLSDLAPAGRHLPGLGAGAPAHSILPSVFVDSDVVTFALPYRERVLSENNDKFTETGIRLLSLDFESEDTHQTAQLGRGLYMAGACPLHYDGRAWTEQNFHFGPELIEHSQNSGGSIDPGAYLYVAWYEWTDFQGEIHRGPTSIDIEVDVLPVEDGAAKITLTLPTLRVTKKDNVRIVVARSRANDETELFRVTSSDPNTAGADNGYVSNDPTIDTATFVDSMSDGDLATQEPAYTNGGILSNDPSALGSAIARSKSRLFWTDPSDGNTIRFSQPLDDGYGAECPPELTIKCDPYGGNITALGEMDGVVYAFKESAIFGFQGDGPPPNGDPSVDGFSTPELLTSDVGCVDPASIALTPVGLVFKSAKGIYLLSRERQVSYIGAPVEAYNAQTIRRATVMPNRTAVIFLTDDGKSLLYDHFFGQWSTFTNHAGHDAAIVDGTYVYLRTDERIFREAEGYSDAGKRIQLRIETAWIHLQEYLQGFARFWHVHVLGERKSAHQLKAQYRLDYGKQWSDPVYCDATGEASVGGWLDGVQWIGDGEDSLIGSEYGDGNYGDGPYGGQPPGVYEWRVHIGERGQAIQLAFEDYEKAGDTGASFELTEMLITGGVKGVANKPYSEGRSL